MTPHEAQEKMADDLKGVVRDAEDLMKATTGQAGERLTEIRNRLKAAMETAKVNATKLKEKSVEAAKATDQVIRTHPYESLGVAFGVGLLIGVLVARRR